MTLVREMPVLAAARIIEITDNRLWRIVHFYVRQAMHDIDLSGLEAFGLDETASKRGHNYVTVFIDLERDTKPVIFATPGKGKSTVKEFRKFLEQHGGDAHNIVEVVCDMSPAFLAATEEHFPYSYATVDWFHVVQLFTKALDDVRRAEAKERSLPKATRWAVLKASDKGLTDAQIDAIVELEVADLCTAKAWRTREMLRWVNKAESLRAARWRMTYFINYAKELTQDNPLLAPVVKALNTLDNHKQRVLRRWRSFYTNARLEGLNSLFQAARSRARGYRNTHNFITMIYLIAAPLGKILNSTRNVEEPEIPPSLEHFSKRCIEEIVRHEDFDHFVNWMKLELSDPKKNEESGMPPDLGEAAAALAFKGERFVKCMCFCTDTVG